jgi:hypothetical protein
MPEEQLLRARDEQDVAKMREHAWEVFAGLTTERGGLPVWQTWYTKCDVHLALEDCPPAATVGVSRLGPITSSLEISPQTILQLEQLMEFALKNQADEAQESEKATEAVQSFLDAQRRHPQLASVFFNRPAANHILENKLYEGQTLDRIHCERTVSRSFKSESEIPPFPRRAVVVKAAWELVRLDAGYLTTPVHVWNPKLQASFQIQDNKLGSSEDWLNPVRIDTNPSHKCEDGKDYDGVAPLDCFFAFPIDKDLITQDLIKLVGEFINVPHTPGKYYLVLMGLHVMTKEAPDWLWATFWWHNHPNHPDYGSDRPPRSVLRGNHWRHFLMNTTLSRMTPIDPPPQGGGPKICFNPYLEEDQKNGVVSNCIQCHRHAAYSNEDKTIEGQQLGLTWRDGKTPPRPTPRDPHYFDDVLRSDYVWSIATTRSTNLRNFLTNLLDELQLKSQ